MVPANLLNELQSCESFSKFAQAIANCVMASAKLLETLLGCERIVHLSLKLFFLRGKNKNNADYPTQNLK